MFLIGKIYTKQLINRENNCVKGTFTRSEIGPDFFVLENRIKEPITQMTMKNVPVIFCNNLRLNNGLNFVMYEQTWRLTGTSNTFKCGLRWGPTTVLNFNSDSSAPSNTSASLCPYKDKSLWNISICGMLRNRNILTLGACLHWRTLIDIVNAGIGWCNCTILWDRCEWTLRDKT